MREGRGKVGIKVMLFENVRSGKSDRQQIIIFGMWYEGMELLERREGGRGIRDGDGVGIGMGANFPAWFGDGARLDVSGLEPTNGRGRLGCNFWRGESPL